MKTKNANGEGTIYKHKSKNLWVSQYFVNNKRKTLYGKTKKEVRDKLIKAQNSINEGSYIESSKLTIAEWLNLWLSTYIVGKKAPKTVECYSNTINKHISPNIGEVLIKDLQPLQVQMLYNSIEKSCGTRMAKMTHIVLHAAFKQAFTNNMIIMNVIDKCKTPVHEPKKSRALTIEEQKKFVEAIKNTRYELAFLLCLYTGLRRGEVLALTWNDVNLETNMISVNKSIVRVSNLERKPGEPKTKLIVSKPKSKSSIREIPIPDGLIKLIKSNKFIFAKERLASDEPYNSHDLLFCNRYGGMLTPESLNKVFISLTNGLFEKSATIHTLRHTYCTRGAESGISMKTMQELLGHSDISQTSNIYTHISSEFKKQEVAKLNVYL